MPVPPDDRLVLHSSWRGVIGASVSAASMAAIALVSWGGGPGVISIGLTLLAVGIATIVLFDYPVSSEFRADGVVRRCPLRHQRLGWDRIQVLTRTADTVTTAERGRRGVRGRPAGLVAAAGRRRYLLVNQCESRAECEALRELMRRCDAPTRWQAGLPAEDQPPTWLYRRRRWRP